MLEVMVRERKQTNESNKYDDENNNIIDDEQINILKYNPVQYIEVFKPRISQEEKIHICGDKN